MNNRINNQKGASLPLVLVTLLILSIFSLTAIFLSTSNFKSAKREEDRTKAYYISRTGSEAFANYIIRKPTAKNPAITIEELKEFVGKKSKPTSFGDGEFTISVQEVDENSAYKVTSVGTVNGVSETTSVIINPNELEFSVSSKIFRDRALFTSSEETQMQLNSLGSGYIKGHNQEKGPVHTFHNEIQYNTPKDKNRVEAKTGEDVKKMIKKEELIEPDFTTFRNLEHLTAVSKTEMVVENKYQTISKNKKLSRIQVRSEKTLEIDATKENIELIVKDDIQLDDSSTLHIITKPSTKVDIHVGSIQLQNKSKLKITGGGDVNIISKGKIQLNDYIEITGEESRSSEVNFKSLTEIQIDNKTELKFDKNIMVYFYTKGNIQLQESSTLNASNNAKVHFFSDGGSIDMFQSTKITTDADKHKEATKVSQIFIVAISAKVTLNQNSVFEGYVYAPKSDLQIHQNAKLRGSFIGKTLQTGSNMQLDHAWPSDEDVAHLQGIIPNGSKTGVYKDPTYTIKRREQ